MTVPSITNAMPWQRQLPRSTSFSFGAKRTDGTCVTSPAAVSGDGDSPLSSWDAPSRSKYLWDSEGSERAQDTHLGHHIRQHQHLNKHRDSAPCRGPAAADGSNVFDSAFAPVSLRDACVNSNLRAGFVPFKGVWDLTLGSGGDPNTLYFLDASTAKRQALGCHRRRAEPETFALFGFGLGAIACVDAAKQRRRRRRTFSPADASLPSISRQ